MLIGYARVSTDEQRLDLQLDALKAAGCERIFQDHGVSGGAVIKPGLIQALDFARPGDTLVVWRLDRLSRSFTELIATVTGLEPRKLEFKSLKDEIDTSTHYGRLYFHLMAALAEFERGGIHERTLAGMAAARLQGRYPGRPGSINAIQWPAIKSLLLAGQSVPLVASAVGVSRQAIYYRLTQEIDDVTFDQFQSGVANGADRADLIARMNLFPPALAYREVRAARGKAA